MDYKALTYLMVGERRLNPGETVSSEELESAGQSEDSIKSLVEGGALSDDLEADLHEAHAVVEAPVVEGTDNNVVATEEGSGKS